MSADTRTFKPATLMRYWAKVDRQNDDECWPWLGSTRVGYGRFWTGARDAGAHRVAYELAVGPIPEGLVIDHLCRNRACVNPAHLEPVTNRENILRGVSSSAQRARQTHCKYGHEFTPENTYIEPSCWRRHCRICRVRFDRERRAS